MMSNASGGAYDSLRFAEIDARDVVWGAKLGEGAQAVVFSGTFQGEAVAIKRIKLNGVVSSSVSSALRVQSPRQRGDEQKNEEAAYMRYTAAHHQEDASSAAAGAAAAAASSSGSTSSGVGRLLELLESLEGRSVSRR